MAFELSATPEHDALLNLMFEPADLDNLSTPDEPEFNKTHNPMDHTQEDTMKEAHTQIQVPTHPIATMQEAFAESMREASGGSTPSIPKNTIGNASARRKHLLDQDINEPTHAARWQSKPGLRYHELWKLMAQISFGIYLLLNGIAKDDEQVMNILQGHVDEVDEFLETTLEDFDLAQQDVDERLKFLKLPLENIAIFDAMLEDRNFRLQIVNGNERIEHVITRTATAMNDALKDVTQGLDACKEFTIYLAEEQEDRIWREERPEMQKVFDAMKGNVEGWYKAYVSLQTKGNHLGVGLVQLGSIVAEMDRRAGEVSRRKRFSVPQSTPPRTSPPSSPVRHSKQMRQSMLKNLPEDPSAITPAIRATLPAFQMVQDRERTPEPEPQIQDDESLAELEAPEDNLILKPRTYTPIPSPREPPPRIETPPPEPEVTKKPSLRQRFSLKRKESPSASKDSSQDKGDSYWAPRQRVQSPAPKANDRTVNTPPSRGLDSAYCSDLEKTSPPGFAPPYLQQTRSHTSSANSAQTQPLPQRTFSEVLPSPRSEQQQYFRPVNASPHSPLQRPWTAAPREISHIHSNSSTSNLSTLRGQQNAPSVLGNRRGAPSAMGMSMASGRTGMTGMTGMTTQTDANGMQQKVKKKRSAFGWLKKAFSLSEEEKAAFEEKRRKNDHAAESYRKDYYQKPAPRWVDGKKVRSSASQKQVMI